MSEQGLCFTLSLLGALSPRVKQSERESYSDLSIVSNRSMRVVYFHLPPRLILLPLKLLSTQRVYHSALHIFLKAVEVAMSKRVDRRGKE